LAQYIGKCDNENLSKRAFHIRDEMKTLCHWSFETKFGYVITFQFRFVTGDNEYLQQFLGMSKGGSLYACTLCCSFRSEQNRSYYLERTMLINLILYTVGVQKRAEDLKTKNVKINDEDIQVLIKTSCSVASKPALLFDLELEKFFSWEELEKLVMWKPSPYSIHGTPVFFCYPNIPQINKFKDTILRQNVVPQYLLELEIVRIPNLHNIGYLAKKIFTCSYEAAKATNEHGRQTKKAGKEKFRKIFSVLVKSPTLFSNVYLVRLRLFFGNMDSFMDVLSSELVILGRLMFDMFGVYFSSAPLSHERRNQLIITLFFFSSMVILLLPEVAKSLYFHNAFFHSPIEVDNPNFNFDCFGESRVEHSVGQTKRSKNVQNSRRFTYRIKEHFSEVKHFTSKAESSNFENKQTEMLDRDCTSIYFVKFNIINH
jgi:hypothetical protein